MTGGFVDLFGAMKVRAEGAGKARLCVDSHAGLGNISGNVHGGFLLALVDQALFVGPEMSGIAILGGVTIDVTSQFLAAVVIGPPIEVVTEVLRETGRMLFVRGQIEQDWQAKLAFSGTLRKPDRR